MQNVVRTTSSKLFTRPVVQQSIQIATKDRQIHHTTDGVFTNPWNEWSDPSKNISGLLSFQKDMLTTTQKEFHLPLKELNTTQIRQPDPASLQYTWIGHSTFILQQNGVNVLTDPVFSHRASPMQWVGPSRIVAAPCTVETLPCQIHYVVISHNHYDHLDYNSVKKLIEHHNPVFLVPLNLKQWFIDNGVASDRIFELDWWNSISLVNGREANYYQDADKSLSDAQPVVDFTFLPAQHWSSRFIRDKNTTLWGSWAIQYNQSNHNNTKVYFAGDTGYSSCLFKEIGNHEGPFDLALLPIGAYEPRWFMKPQHVNPEEAVQISLDIRSNKSIGMHWGTFILTTEPIMQPKELLEEELQKRNLPDDYFLAMQHGDTQFISFDK